MSSEIETKSANRIGPKLGDVTSISVTSTSARTQLSAELNDDVTAGDFFTFQAVGADVYLGLNSSDAGTVDDTSPANADRGFVFKDGVPQDFRLPRDSTGLCEWIVAKTASGTATLQVFRSSRTEET